MKNKNSDMGQVASLRPASARQAGDKIANVQRNLRSCHVSRVTHEPSTLNRRRAFTLIELLVVIAVIGTLAALILPVVGAVKKHQYIYNTQAELAQLETAIDRYKATYGFYPPSNTNAPGCPESYKTNQLYFELVGTIFTNNTFVTLDSSTTIKASDVSLIFGVGGFINCTRPGSGEDAAAAKSFLTDLRPRQLAPATLGSSNAKLLAASVGGPETGYQPMGVPNLNPWRYNSTNPTNNPGSYELWTELSIGSMTNESTHVSNPKLYQICNWTKQVQVNAPMP